ncbi:GroES-like protein [Aspergillus brunneoviolaceus CBS 621.78]|uniref:GroES-like protein n=1 Tax=Aspergillus brunneoviolaceus CBS 621.78 TaxID=1450534 RepID=A0ACD1FWV0_9EURO|nr:GroES-like protein [Aspergillus brunneoviolaceus CBS 621.78]RAH41454.1 GroES-like protein [Aspergillus brunneoviolaceus CBS 621.78]
MSGEQQQSMRVVAFRGPYKVAVEERPVPRIQDARDVVVKVKYTALCGSDLHVYRGIEPNGEGVVMGHEVTGVVVEVGDEVRSVKKGDSVVSAFTTSW